MPDYAAKARALRAKAADPVVPDVERRALLEKARELEAKYGNANSPFTNDTTVLGRDGRPPYGSPGWYTWVEVQRMYRQQQATQTAEDLAREQWRWNTEYYDIHGNPRRNEADTDDDYLEETYAWEDEDANYDILQEDDPYGE